MPVTAGAVTWRILRFIAIDTATEQVTRDLRERLHHEISEPALEALAHLPSSVPAHDHSLNGGRAQLHVSCRDCRPAAPGARPRMPRRAAPCPSVFEFDRCVRARSPR